MLFFYMFTFCTYALIVLIAVPLFLVWIQDCCRYGKIMKIL